MCNSGTLGLASKLIACLLRLTPTLLGCCNRFHSRITKQYVVCKERLQYTSCKRGLCRNAQLVPANAFGSMVHCLAVAGSDLWCCTGGGTIAVLDLVTLNIKTKVRFWLCNSKSPRHGGTLQLKQCSGNTDCVLQAFAAHNGEILSAAVVPSFNTMGSIVLTGGHDWQVLDSIYGLCL